MPESKLYEMADRVWPAHGTTSNELRDRNIEKMGAVYCLPGKQVASRRQGDSEMKNSQFDLMMLCLINIQSLQYEIIQGESSIWLSVAFVIVMCSFVFNKWAEHKEKSNDVPRS